jgi:hypothetical protein
MATARAGVDAIDGVRRNGQAEFAIMQDVAEPALELVVAVAAHGSERHDGPGCAAVHCPQ